MRTTLGELFEIGSGGTPSKAHPEYYGGDIPWVKTGDLKEEYLYSVEDYITEEGLNNSSAKMYLSGTVLIAMYGATIGATSILKFDACTNQACAAFKPCKYVIPEYLYYFLRSKKQKFISDGVGGAQPNISVGYLKKVSIDIRTIEEQEKVVTVLDKINGIVQKRQNEIDELDNLIKARFVEMFGDLKINPKGWSLQTFDELSELITDGEHATPKRTSEGIYLLSARNVLNHAIQLDDVDYIDQDEYDRISKRIVPKEGDVLISCSGSVGRCCSVPKGMKFQMVRSAALIRFKDGILPLYAEYMITSDFVQEQINASKTASSQANLFQGKIAKLKGFVPSVELQNEFADFVKQVDKSKIAVQKALEETQTLFDSLMQEYFG